jgi:hypothetical protein
MVGTWEMSQLCTIVVHWCSMYLCAIDRDGVRCHPHALVVLQRARTLVFWVRRLAYRNETTLWQCSDTEMVPCFRMQNTYCRDGLGKAMGVEWRYRWCKSSVSHSTLM